METVSRREVTAEDVHVYPITIIMDRYGGVYSKANWTAWHCEPNEIPDDAQGGDSECMRFWEYHRAAKHWMVGFGKTPDEAEADLRAKLRENKEKA